MCDVMHTFRKRLGIFTKTPSRFTSNAFTFFKNALGFPGQGTSDGNGSLSASHTGSLKFLKKFGRFLSSIVSIRFLKAQIQLINATELSV